MVKRIIKYKGAEALARVADSGVTQPPTIPPNRAKYVLIASNGAVRKASSHSEARAEAREGDTIYQAIEYRHPDHMPFAIYYVNTGQLQEVLNRGIAENLARLERGKQEVHIRKYNGNGMWENVKIHKPIEPRAKPPRKFVLEEFITEIGQLERYRDPEFPTQPNRLERKLQRDTIPLYDPFGEKHNYSAAANKRRRRPK